VRSIPATIRETSSRPNPHLCRLSVDIDRSKANALGISMRSIGDTLALLVGKHYVNRFNRVGRSYEVIQQVPLTPSGRPGTRRDAAASSQGPRAAPSEQRAKAIPHRPPGRLRLVSARPALSRGGKDAEKHRTDLDYPCRKPAAAARSPRNDQREGGSRPFDLSRYYARVKSAVRVAVEKQAAAGIDISADGEMGRIGFIPYVHERLSGIEPRQVARGQHQWRRPREYQAFPEYYEWASVIAR